MGTLKVLEEYIPPIAHGRAIPQFHTACSTNVLQREQCVLSV